MLFNKQVTLDYVHWLYRTTEWRRKRHTEEHRYQQKEMDQNKEMMSHARCNNKELPLLLLISLCV